MDIFGQIPQLLASRVSFVLATVVDAQGSAPRKPGAKMLVLSDGSLKGTIGGGAIEHRVVAVARELLADRLTASRLIEADLTHDLGMCCGGSMRVFLEKLGTGERLFIFGAGHVGQALSALARAVGFDVTVADARAQLLTEERFPSCERVLADPRQTAAQGPLDDRSLACVMTHDHQLDQEVVIALMRRPLRYLGLIGSKRKAEKCRARLLAEGFGADEARRLRSPMGMPIGGQSPEEIALSIAAELVAVRSGCATWLGAKE